MRKARSLLCESGTAAVEFALVLLPFLMVLIGTMSATLAVYTAASLHYAVEGAARCFSISACSSATAAQSKASSLYSGPSSPTFVASTPACGHQVSGTLTFVLNAGVTQWNVPLSATACYP